MRASSRTIDSAELVNRIETPATVAYNYPNVIGSMQRDLDDNGGSRICQIEYQVVRNAREMFHNKSWSNRLCLRRLHEPFPP
ncbi:hypothetical protein K0M31_014984 [Melipona bicolor]|uniref:Uncharacterized protein n=1 Tax=Melipona bicolor TaxID=60889 RepID=A0AA40FHK4_9HYME|nr:hypothetical protein K0M31_014984 [Melipona bicolor]